MADPATFRHIDPKTAAYLLCRGVDPSEMERWTQGVLQYLYTCLPDKPGDDTARLSALHVLDPSGDDRISALPFALLCNIVSRLPAKDAARTTVLSSRWRPIWRCTPLAFADAHLLDDSREPTRADTPALVDTISHILAAHPGPFRTAHLVCGYMDAYQQQLARWIQALAGKKIEELVLVNQPWPLDVPLPAALFGVSSLTRLYLGIWKLSTTPILSRCAAFPHLRELVLCSVDMGSRDMDFLLAASPILETLAILGSRSHMMVLRLLGQHLRCVQICMSYMEGIVLVDTPKLERLVLWGSLARDGCSIRLKIGQAPNLRVLGHLEPGIHHLESGIRARVSSVRILALRIRFAIASDVKMLFPFLRCFTNLETLHVTSEISDEVTGNPNLKFWQEASPIQSFQSSLKTMTFWEFRGEQSEVAFLKFMFQSAVLLKSALVMVSSAEIVTKVQALGVMHLANQECSLVVCVSAEPEGGGIWSIQKGGDFSVRDPFA
ncbi:hypothetical protein EJB05_18454, partial [Eragrostis curvula]